MTSDMRKLYAVSKLLGTAEAIVASGLLSAELEGKLREHIVDTCNAFGVPTIAERSSQLVSVGDHDPDTLQEERYRSIEEAGRLGYCATSIYRCLTGERALHAGKTWRLDTAPPADALEAGRQALTAPGATTKSDGGEERPASNPLSEVTHRPSDPKTSPELLALLERAKSHVMTPEDVYEQRRSFVRGMCPSDRDYTEWCADVDRIIPPLAGPSDTRPADVTVDEPRCDCGHLFEICDAPNCNRALLDTYKIGAK